MSAFEVKTPEEEILLTASEAALLCCVEGKPPALHQ